MACFLYEGMIVFGIGLIPGLIGAMAFGRSGGPPSSLGETALQVCAFLVYGLYFVGFWSTRGQTLPMQTWQIRVETQEGALPARARAALRYVASWIWIAPPTILSSLLHWSPWRTLAALAAWIVLYAASARLQRERQFWHDVLCRTRLVVAPTLKRT
jgi:uncharacterized RDD family membrane protein YckC